MMVRELMTSDPACCTPDTPIERAAQLMVERDCGCIPVVDDADGRRLLGVVTDRDLAARAIARGRGPDTRVRDVMTSEPFCCSPHADLHEVERIMAEHQVRRVPVIDGGGCCVGIVAQADIARAEPGLDDHEVRETIERISAPSQPAVH